MTTSTTTGLKSSNFQSQLQLVRWVVRLGFSPTRSSSTQKSAMLVSREEQRRPRWESERANIRFLSRDSPDIINGRFRPNSFFSRAPHSTLPRSFSRPTSQSGGTLELAHLRREKEQRRTRDRRRDAIPGKAFFFLSLKVSQKKRVNENTFFLFSLALSLCSQQAFRAPPSLSFFFGLRRNIKKKNHNSRSLRFFSFLLCTPSPPPSRRRRGWSSAEQKRRWWRRKRGGNHRRSRRERPQTSTTAPTKSLPARLRRRRSTLRTRRSRPAATSPRRSRSARSTTSFFRGRRC